MRFEDDGAVKAFIGPKKEAYPFLDLEHPITVGSYMNEPDLIGNRYEIHLAMKEAAKELPALFEEYEMFSGRDYEVVEGYCHEDAEILLVVLGSSFETARIAVDELREKGKKAGLLTLHALRPFPTKKMVEACKRAKIILVADRQDSYGGVGGNLSMEVRAALQKADCHIQVKNLVYGLGGKDFFAEDAKRMFAWAENGTTKSAYYGVEKQEEKSAETMQQYFAPLTAEKTRLGISRAEEAKGGITIKGGTLNETIAIPKRLAPGHGACPGCGIPVNINLLMRGIEDPVVFLFISPDFHF